MLRTTVNTQQGRVMHDTDSPCQQQGTASQRRTKTGRVKERERVRVSHCVCVCVRDGYLLKKSSKYDAV